ncbi:hypothetical protein DFP92_12038 [Yoonia sediminilitoris]|uniref:Uncharacterized protein n=1 Tax=Yoonia sediminilitoris TaxID=1286148 RepID=A0A2T6K6K9_9RHOB|nr:hypothetical protein C8N45_12038 [Yoonia sediminilitoris]RCW89784.1 hypothetical protein DFP92_12038 [Yoonia sediminilitoris]
MSFREECQQLLDQYVSYYRKGDAAGCASVYSLEAEMYSPFGPPAIDAKPSRRLTKNGLKTVQSAVTTLVGVLRALVKELLGAAPR